MHVLFGDEERRVGREVAVAVAVVGVGNIGLAAPHEVLFNLPMVWEEHVPVDGA